MKPNLLIIANRTLNSAPRVIREIDALKSQYTITTIGLTPPNEINIKHIDYRIFDLHIIDKIAWRVLKIIDDETYLEKCLPMQMKKLKSVIKETLPEYIIIHEPYFLPYLAKVKKAFNIKIIFNAHEYHPLEFEEDGNWSKKLRPYYLSIYRKYLLIVDLMVNVCDTIADKCEEEFGKKSLIIPNAALYKSITPKDNRGNKVIKMIYHGNCSPDRKIEEMIEVAKILGNSYSLDLMFSYTENDYARKIILLAGSLENVNIIPPVKFSDIIVRINEYDLGIYILAPVSFNNKAALPNKFFEYIQARLCVAIAPTLEMKRITELFNLGVVSENFTAVSLAQTISKLSKEDIFSYKLNADNAAQKLSAEHHNIIFLNSVKGLS